MRGILLLTQAEINRLRRNRRYFLFTLGLPVILYLIVAKAGDSTAYGVAFAAYYMVAMATFGVVQRRAERQLDQDRGGTQGRLDQAAAAHPAARRTPTWSPSC